MIHNAHFDEQKTLEELKHHLPAQAPLKDFIHHNTLHAFQNLRFFKALNQASEIFGYKVSLALDEYRAYFREGRIREKVLEKVIIEMEDLDPSVDWKNRCLQKKYAETSIPRVGRLRANWE